MAGVLGHIGRVTLLIRYWPFAALVAAIGMLAAAHGFETFGHMSPCTLCLKAREVYWWILPVAAIGGGAGLFSPLARRATCVLLAVMFLGGAGLAVYHAGAEWKFWPGPSSCSGGMAHVGAADLARLLHGGPVSAPACDKAAWVFLGVSMAGWNGLISLVLAGASLFAARKAPA